MEKLLEKFSLKNQVCIITGGAGLLGLMHAEAILEADGIPVILDIDKEKIDKAVGLLKEKYKKEVLGIETDITKEEDLQKAREQIVSKFGRIDVLINNAANDAKVESEDKNWTLLENFPEDVWEKDLTVGLKGAFLCSKVFGSYMAEKKKGVILNIASDLGLIAPDQRIYEDGVKPVTYSVVKHGLIGLTRYLATYWAKDNIRVNAVCPGGIFNEKLDEAFLERLTNLIPMGRMANKDEYKAIILLLITQASSYMTGSIISVDGGRTCW